MSYSPELQRSIDKTFCAILADSLAEAGAFATPAYWAGKREDRDTLTTLFRNTDLDTRWLVWQRVRDLFSDKMMILPYVQHSREKSKSRIPFVINKLMFG